MPREPIITPRKTRTLRGPYSYSYHDADTNTDTDKPACPTPIFPCRSPDKKGAIAFPLPPARTDPAPIFPYTPDCSFSFSSSSSSPLSPSTTSKPEPSCFHWPPTPTSRLFSFCLDRSTDVFGDTVEEYTDIGHYRGWNSERERFLILGEDDKAQEHIKPKVKNERKIKSKSSRKSESKSGYIDLRIMWPGYPSSELTYYLNIHDLTRRQVAEVVANRVYAFIKDIETKDKQAQRTSCALRSADGVGYSGYDIFHKKIEPENVMLVALENTRDNLWHPRLKLVGVGDTASEW